MKTTTILEYGLSALASLRQVLDLVDVDCRELDMYSYGLVEVDAGRGIATISLRDERGAIIHHEGDASVACIGTISW